jgi:hypothetical protein
MRMGRVGAVLALALACGPVRADDSGFSIALKFDPAASEALVKRDEWTIVSAIFYGRPNKAGEEHASEGEVFLGRTQVTVMSVDQTVAVSGNPDAEALSKWVEGGVVRVNVNVFTARFTDDKNLLNCGIFEDDVAVARANVPEISCKLLHLQ